MEKVNHTTERIIVKLREVEVLYNQGKTIVEAVRQIEVTTDLLSVAQEIWRDDRQ